MYVNVTLTATVSVTVTGDDMPTTGCYKVNVTVISYMVNCLDTQYT